MRSLFYILITISLLNVSGCGNMNSIYRKLDVSEGNGALIDIKQRAIIVSKRNNETLVCAEPSPDALSAYAAEFAAEADLPDIVTAQLAAAFQEGSAYVGLRTHSIQLLRDSLYRLCEGYMNNAVSKAQYEILMRRHQRIMVALLAIEQLTGAIAAPPITIQTQGSAETTRSISKIISDIEAINAKISLLEAERADEGTTDERRAQIDKEIEDLKKLKNALIKGMENPCGLEVTGTVTPAVYDCLMNNQKSEEEIQAVSGVVKKIVLNIINTDDSGALCWNYLEKTKPNEQNTELAKWCIKRLNADPIIQKQPAPKN